MDKNKIIEGAAKLVAKGAYDKAIKEYQKVLDADPKDVRVLQKMGELYQKKNENPQAAHYFTKVAESYSNDGFFLKAVALYKQVLKLNPNLIDVNLKLADLHQQLGLMSEAMAYFQVVANHHDRNGDTKSSLDTLKKMVDLDPDNVASKIKLAELYAREKMNSEAISEFRRAAEYLKRNNRAEDYARVAERLSALEPENHPLAKELAASYLQHGDQKRALAKLQVCFKADPKDVETLTLLAQAFQGLGQTSKTVSVYKELAKIHQERGQAGEENKVWSQIKLLDPADPDLAARFGAPAAAAPAAPSRPAPQYSAPAPAPAPSRPAAPTPSAAPTGGPGRDQLAKLLTETDVYVKYGLHDKALEHLRKVFGMDPENLDAHEKAYHIYLGANNAAQASEQLLNVLRLCTRRNEVSRAQPYLATILQQNPSHPEVPAFLSVLQGDGSEGHHAAQPEALGDDAILVDSSEEEIIVADAPEDALAVSDDVALESAAQDYSDEVVSDEFADEEPVVADDVVEGDGFELAADAEEESLTNPGMDEPLLGDEQTFSTMPEGDAFSVADEVVEDAEEYSAAAYADEDEPKTNVNVSAYPEPEASFEEEEEEQHTVMASPADFGLNVQRGARPATPPPAVVEEVSSIEEEVEEPAAEECDEASFFLDQGLTEEAQEILETVQIAYPGHARAAELMARLEGMLAAGGDTGPQDMPSEEEVAPPQVDPVDDNGGGSAFDLAAELADELGELGGGEEAGAASAAGDDFQYSVDEVFSEFKKGLEKVVKPEDVETHYDLGIAYKEMGLLDDAVGEFTVARKGCLGKKKEVDCLTMMGLLQGMQGNHAAAVGSFKEALTSEHAIGEVQKALLFELATASEAAGQPGKALFHYQKVAKLDPKYRDVGTIVARLAAQTSPEDDPLPPRGGTPPKGSPPATGGAARPPDAAAVSRRKVGYV
ncbi:MAG: tetratricopeptide repeat protein [Myxococcota bacterium]|nr:tetratricopeptide repeat protein [Myxococcota bacterium]